MKIFSISQGQDTGGQAVRLAGAFSRRTRDWQFRSMAASQTFIGYPVDLPWPHPRNMEQLLARYDAADVIHSHNGILPHRWYDNGQGKPTVVHWHGTSFRSHHGALWAEADAIGAVQLAATLDLEILEPGLTWLPAPFNFDGPLYPGSSGHPTVPSFADLRAANFRPHDGIIVAHAPTNRAAKGSDRIHAALERLAERYPIRLIEIEGEPWFRCLQQKARADIFVDQITLGYGNNAVEAWGMGMPVVAGTMDPAVRARMLEVWGRLPFVEGTDDTIEDALELLIASQDARREWAEIGMEHARRWHDEQRVVEVLQDIYSAAPATMPGGDLKRHVARRRRIERGRAGRRGEAVA